MGALVRQKITLIENWGGSWPLEVVESKDDANNQIESPKQTL